MAYLRDTIESKNDAGYVESEVYANFCRNPGSILLYLYVTEFKVLIQFALSFHEHSFMDVAQLIYKKTNSISESNHVLAKNGPAFISQNGPRLSQFARDQSQRGNAFE